MVIKIGLITMNRDLICQFRSVIGEFFPDIEMRVEKISDEGAVEATRQLAWWGSEIIICSSVSANDLISGIVDVPIILIPKQHLDIMEALKKASKYGHLIGLISFVKFPLQIDLMEEITGTKIKPILLQSQRMLPETLKKAFQDGLEVVVGGIITQKVARACGKHSVLVKYGKETIFNALQNARFAALAARKEKEKNKLIQTIIEYANEGMIVIDRNGITHYFNPYAENILGLPFEKVLDKPIEAAIPCYDFKQALLRGKSFTEVIALEKVHIFINTVPIKTDGKVSGLVLYFKNLKELQEQEIKARRKINRHGMEAKYNIDHFVSRSASMQEMIRRTHKFSRTDSTILITGESGVGKEVVAQSLHNLSPRKHQPFVAVNCSTLQENLLDSELFGYEEGAFTGARKGGKAGLFELAHKGTIFLDEIRELSLVLQAKLLRVLQEKEIRRIGGEINIPVDVRVVAATNTDLTKVVEENHFRKDLYFRLNILSLHVPPLRDRLEDLPILVDALLQQFSLKCGKDDVHVSPQLLEQMTRYSWPGNVRELENFLERLVLLFEEADGNKRLDLQLFKELEAQGQKSVISPEVPPMNLSDSFEMSERKVLIKALERVKYRKNNAAKILGISRSTLWRKLHEYGLENVSKKAGSAET